MDQRQKFIAAFILGEQSVSALARQFGVSRKTANKWLARFRAGGFRALDPRSSRPHQPANELSEPVRAAILAARDAHPSWGPKKLRAHLADHPALAIIPAASSIGRVLKSAGKIDSRRRTAKAYATPTSLTPPTSPNHVWTVDFKGWFVTTDGVKCYPLTIMDSHSRYLLACVALTETSGATVRPTFEWLFTTSGLPAIIRSDNGPPFASPGLNGFTALNVWWRRLGIRLERIAPGHPEQNGRHERLHRTLKAEVLIAADCAAQQRLFDAFLPYYNTQRPHEALRQRPPASLYTRSPRSAPATLPALSYPAQALVRVVRDNGTIRCWGKELYLTTALTGEAVALLPNANGQWWVVFAQELLGWCTEHEVVLRGKQGQTDRLLLGPAVTF